MSPAMRAVLPSLLSLAVLDTLLAFDNLWPTLWPRPALRLSFELVMALALLAGCIAWRGAASPRLLRLLGAVTAIAVVARYLDVTVSAVFGRQINLYWDARHLADVVAMGGTPAWKIALASVGAIALPVLVYALAVRCWRSIAGSLASPGLRRVTGVGCALLFAIFAAHGIDGRNTRWFFSMPISPIVHGQLALLAKQWWPGAATARLTPSPAFAPATLDGLAGADVLLIFAESYGATTLDDAGQATALAPARERFAKAIAAGGRGVVSARVGSPTFAGASWLAHAALLAGVDTRDPGAYELLLSTQRPTLVSHFREHGWRTVNWAPGLQRPWPEGRFYGFDRYADAESLGYRGPAFGHWRVPDQASMALLHAQELEASSGRPGSSASNQPRQPRFVVFPTLASHAPFKPLAPFVGDWSRLLTDAAYGADDVARADTEAPSWLRPVPAYIESLDYTFAWLGDYLARRATRDLVTIVIGDHQPLASVSGPGASWDVPVHVISGNRALLTRLSQAGFQEGLRPRGPTLGAMHELTPLLVRAFDGPAPAAGATAAE